MVAQDVFRLHALVSATSQHISRALFVDRVMAHRVDGGPVRARAAAVAERRAVAVAEARAASAQSYQWF